MTLFLITAPSGAGKTTLVKSLAKKRAWTECISHTTRKPRVGEEDGVSYFFVDKEQFNTMVENSGFAEIVTYDGNLYGVSKSEIDSCMQKYINVCIIVDHEGYKQIKRVYPDSVGVFLYSTIEDCVYNMLGRGDSLQEAVNRSSKYEDEMKNRIGYDYVIKNPRGSFNRTLDVVHNIIAQH